MFITKQPTLTTFHILIRPELKTFFIDWQGKLNAAIVGCPGFISLEFISKVDPHHAWVIVQRFYTHETAVMWRRSALCEELMKELLLLAQDGSLHETSDEESNLRNGVTEFFITEVNPEKEQAFRDWNAKIHQIEAKFDGFQGVYIQSPHEGGCKNWITLLQFDTPTHLDLWLESAERKNLLLESEDFISSLETHRMISPYAGWFSSIAKTEELPSVWKQAMLVLLVLFPIVIVEMKFLSPLLIGMNVSLSTFFSNIISVSLITFPMMPMAIWLLGWWLSPGINQSKKKKLLGVLVIFLLYAIEIAAFWHLFD